MLHGMGRTQDTWIGGDVNRMKCPHCGSYNTDVDEFEPHFDDECAIVPFYCHSCGATWNSVYKFDCNEEVDVLRKEGR